jgi:hypothetical protein
MKRLGLRRLGMLVMVASFLSILILMASCKKEEAVEETTPATTSAPLTQEAVGSDVETGASATGTEELGTGTTPPPAGEPGTTPPPLHSAEAEFPWPAPTPSAYYRFPPHLLGSARSFGEVADRLELALNQAGYTENKFYSIKNNGFAVVTRIESMLSNGSCRPPNQRWVVDSPSLFTLKDYLAALFRAHKGFYRVWAFTVTSLPEGFTGPPPTQAEIDALFSRGQMILPPPLRALPFTGDYYCLALVYQFERKDVPPPLLRLPSPLTGVQHLTASTILQHLEH